MLPRLHLFEFGDSALLPPTWREVYHDTLGFVLQASGVYKRMYAPYRDWTSLHGEPEVMDFASGGAGPVQTILETAKSKGISLPRVMLSDLYPQETRYRELELRCGQERVGFISKPVDIQVPLKHFQASSIFSAFHHFEPREAKRILNQLLSQGKSVFVAEPFSRSFRNVVLVTCGGFFLGLIAPFFRRPYKVKNFLLSTIVPLIPLMLVFDGLVSVFRTYKADELRAMIPEKMQDELKIRSGHTTVYHIIQSPFFFAVPRRSHAL